MNKTKAESPRWGRKLIGRWSRLPLLHDEAAHPRRAITPSKEYFFYFFLAIGILLLVSFHRQDTLSSSWSFLQDEAIPVAVARQQSNVEGLAFVLLGMGPYARQLKCEAAIESLRFHGGWNGDIYLLTDAPECYLGNSIWSDCHLNAHVLDVDDDLSSGFTVPRLYKTKGNRLQSKKYKTRIFEFVKNPKIQVLIYMDCDMLVAGSKHGVQEFALEHYNQFNNETRIFVYPENNPGAINGIVHTGMFIAHRYWSAPLLQQWRDQLETNNDASDQAAFVRAGITEYQFINEQKYLYRPRCDRDNCMRLLPKCFNHINGARCWHQDKHDIHNFVNRWQLCTYQSHSYCIPWYMSSFAMSWLPYTSCKKMEPSSK